MKNTRRLLCCALLAAWGLAYAHHSTANFDRTHTTTITGKVTYFGFTNPHSFIDIDVVDESTGKAEPWKVFTAARVLMARYDWKVEDLKANDRVTITGYPDRTNPHFLYLTRIVFASGKVWERGQIPD